MKRSTLHSPRLRGGLYIGGVWRHQPKGCDMKRFAGILLAVGVVGGGAPALVRKPCSTIGQYALVTKVGASAAPVAVRALSAKRKQNKPSGAVHVPFITSRDTTDAVRMRLWERSVGPPGDAPTHVANRYTADRQEMAVFVVSPLAGDPILPDRPLPQHARPGREIRLSACRGEYEPASIVVSPFRALRLSVVCGDLKRENTGDVIAASSVVIKGVKCWYQAGTAWHSNAQDKATRVLIPELLLLDDALVRVDHERQENSLRLGYKTGVKYRSISFTEARGWPDAVFPGGMELPVQDSSVLLPLDLPARSYKQLMVTVKVPPNAQPGRYVGNILLKSGGRVLEQVGLRLRVLPFELAEPMRYDLKAPFHSSIYDLQVLEGGPGRIHDQHSRTRAQRAAEMKNMKAHGVTNPICCQLSEVYDLDLFAEVLKIRRETGLANRPMFLGALTHAFANVGFRTQSDPQSLAALKARVTEIEDVVEDVLGHRDVFFYGIDEGKHQELDDQRPLWKAIHEAGGQIIVSGYRPGLNDDAQGAIGRAGDLLDCLISAAGVSRQEADAWHRVGHMVWSYANPQAGRENPRIYRRNYGLEVWKANFDGAATFAYYAALNNPWNDLDYGLRDFLFVYPAIDGVVDTLAWEGYREGIDDIRYATTLARAVASARKSGDPALRAAATSAHRFLETLDLSGDLDAIRRKIVRHILELPFDPVGDGARSTNQRRCEED